MMSDLCWCPWVLQYYNSLYWVGFRANLEGNLGRIFSLFYNLYTCSMCAKYIPKPRVSRTNDSEVKKSSLGGHATPVVSQGGNTRCTRGYTLIQDLENGDTEGLFPSQLGESETWLRLHSQIWKRPMWSRLQRSMVHSTLIYFTFLHYFHFHFILSLYLHYLYGVLRSTSIICDPHFHSNRNTH